MKNTVYKDCRLTMKENENHKTIIKIGEINIGEDFLMIAGPCSVEEEDIMFRISEELVKNGVRFLRAGAYKPRTSPYSFQGLGEKGIAILEKIKNKTGLKIVTEVLDEYSFDKVDQVADILQIGSRNMANFSLLKRVGKQKKPVLLKRGMSATLSEYLMAAEYIMNEGNPNVILCERGIRTFDNHCRNTLDIAAVPSLKKLTHLPVIVDPSHAAGERDLVIPLSKAAIAIGADGLIIETHLIPAESWSDADQAISVSQLGEILDFIHAQSLNKPFKKIKKIA